MGSDEARRNAGEGECKMSLRGVLGHCRTRQRNEGERDGQSALWGRPAAGTALRRPIYAKRRFTESRARFHAAMGQDAMARERFIIKDRPQSVKGCARVDVATKKFEIAVFRAHSCWRPR